MATEGPGGWQTRTLFELADYQNGMAFRPADTRGDGLPIIKIAELNEGIGPSTGRAACEVDPRKVIRPGDLLFAWSGSVGVYKWTGPQAVLNQHIFRVTSKEGVDQTFLRYLLEGQLPIFQRVVDDQATTMGHVKVSDLKRLKVLVPPTEEQRGIASILGSLDDEIELNRLMNQTLEQLAHALFKSWFVDFDPARAKADGRWKKGEGLPGMPADMWDLWPSEFEESEIGEIPKGWDVKPLSELASVTRGVSYRSDDLAESDTALVSLKCAGRDGTYHEDGLKAYRGEFKQEQIVQPGDVVVSHTDVTQRAEVIGRAYRVTPSFTFARLVASLDMAVVRPTSQSQTREYLAHALSAERFRDHCYGYTNGTTVLHLSPQALPGYLHLVPTPNIVGRFSEVISRLNGLLDEHGLESASLSATRNALLPKLLSGEIRVPNYGVH
jgi:type I restriction enzyme, S subunit